MRASAPKPLSAGYARLERVFREPVNSLTHLAGILVAIAATVLLQVVTDGGALARVSLALFGASSVLLYTASTLLHSIRTDVAKETWLRRLDHGAIFVLIAGSYSPVVLIAMQPEAAAWGWVLFGVVWAAAVAGIVFKLLWIGAPRWLSTALYLLMGWLVIVAIVPVVRSLGPVNTWWLAAGGLFYTVGAVIYATKRPDPFPRVFGYHEIWHLFVLAGWSAHLVMAFRLALSA